MLITKPFAKQRTTESFILFEQFNRLSQMTAQNLPSSQFWLGYFAAYSSPISSKTHSPFTLNDWIALSQIMKNLATLVMDEVIKKQNIFELVISSVYQQTNWAITKKQEGIDIRRLGESIQHNLGQIISQTHYLKNKYFSPLKHQDKNGKSQNSDYKPKKQQKKQTKQLYPNQYKSQQKLLKSESKVNKQSSLKKPQQNSGNKKLIKIEEPIMKISKTQTMNLGIQCPICLESITLSTVCPISCGHNLHQYCFIEHFKSKVEIKKFPIVCLEEGCNKQIVIQDIQEYIPKQTLQKYYQFSLHQYVNKNNKNMNWCPTPGCSAVFSFEGDLITYNCLACKKQYCLNCKSSFHPTLTCQENKKILNLPQDQKQFINFAVGAKMKQCPNCQYWVQKNKGCDHMTCRCKYQFCFRCGAKYGECSCQEADSYYGDSEDGQGSQGYSNDEADNWDEGEQDEEDVRFSTQINQRVNSFIRPPTIPTQIHRPRNIFNVQNDPPRTNSIFTNIGRIFFSTEDNNNRNQINNRNRNGIEMQNEDDQEQSQQYYRSNRGNRGNYRK